MTSGKIISLLLEDAPFLYIQFLVLNHVDEEDSSTRMATTLALGFSLLSIFIGIVSFFGRVGSDHKSMRKQYALVRNPADSLFKKHKSLLQEFEKNGYKDSYAWVTITQVNRIFLEISPCNTND